jgi:hypothetical protein
MSNLLSLLSLCCGAGKTETVKAPFALADSYEFVIKLGDASVAGKFQAGVPAYFKADGIDFFRHKDVLVYKDADMWQKARTGTLSDPLRILGPSAKVRSARLPHEELKTLEKVGRFKTSKEKGETFLAGELDEKAAKELARSESRSVARGGSARVWLGPKGATKYEIVIRVQGKLGDAEVDGMETKIVTIDGIGATRVEAPPAVKKLLSAESATPKICAQRRMDRRASGWAR